MEEFKFNDCEDGRGGHTLNLSPNENGSVYLYAEGYDDMVVMDLPKDRAAELGRLLIKWAGEE